MSGAEQLWQVTTPYFCAGFTVEHSGAVIAAAPILRSALRANGLPLTFAKIQALCRQRRWQLDRVS